MKKRGFFLLLLPLIMAATALLRPAEPERKSQRASGRQSAAPAGHDAANFRSPAGKTRPAPAPVDHPGELTRLITEGDFAGMNHATAAWYDADPTAAGEWLEQQESLDAFHPAVRMIAGKLAGDGDLRLGLEWADLLPPGPEREQLLFDIYAMAARGGRFTKAELRTAPLPPGKRELLLGGAPGD